MKVFLGGTMNKSQWREQMIANLECDYFNPMVDVWDEKAQKEEERQKKALRLSFICTHSQDEGSLFNCRSG